MEIFKIEFTVIIVFHLTAITISEVFEIFRTRSPGEDAWVHGTDSFEIPPSLCKQGAIKCAQFRAHTERPCFCSCPNVDATLLLNNNGWRCLDNAHVRRLLGYKPSRYILFDAETLSNPLRLVNINDYKRVSLPQSLKNCRVDEGSSWHIGCNGSEAFNNDTNAFTIVPDGDPRDLPPYFLKVDSGGANTELFEGRIIKLGIVCSGPVNYWLLFKFVGSLNCLAPTFLPTVTTKPQDRTVKSLPSKGPGVVGNTAPTRPGRGQRTVRSSSWGLIAGLTISILFAIIIVGFLVYRRVYSNKFNQPPPLPAKSAKRENTNEINSQSRATHEPNGEDGYRVPDIRHPSIYAASYNVPSRGDNTRPVYASLNIPVGRNTCNHGDTLDSAVYRNPDYDEELRSKIKSPIRLKQPVYDQMEELSLKGAMGPSQDGDNNTQPEGSTLAPYLQGSKRPSQYGTMSSADAVFNTLEKSHPDETKGAEYTNAPLYHVLEEVPHPSVHAGDEGYGTKSI